MKKVLIALAVIAVVAIAGGPLLTAKIAKDALDDQVAQVNEMPGYKAELVNYKKSWFNATAQMRIGMEADYWNSVVASNPAVAQLQLSAPSIVFDLKIAHGPLLLADSVAVGLIAVDGTLNEGDMPELTEFREKVGVESLLTYQQITNLSGVARYQVSSPAFEYSDNGKTLIFGGMELFGNFDLKDRTTTINGGFAEIRIVEPSTTVVIEPVTLTADMEVVNWALQLGTFEMAMPAIKAYAGADTAGEPVMAMNNLKVTTDAHYDGDNDDTVAAKMICSLSDITAQGMKLQDMVLDISIEHLSVKAIEQIAELYTSAMSNAADPQLMQMQLAMGSAALAPEILKYSPAVVISDLSFKLNGEPLKADARVEINSEGLDTTNLNPQLLIQKVVASLNLNLSDALMQQFGPMMGGQQGMFEKTADGYSVKISIKDGAATLNGQPIPLPL